ncbi:MAG: acyltransferase family protein [Thermodesulfobacteriota bacterium]
MSTRSLIDPVTSRRFDVLKLLLVVAVVMIHAEKGILAYLPDPPPVLRAVVVFFGHNLFQLAVPLFFTMSGYLLFMTFVPSRASYFRMVWKKTWGILFPFLFLNLLCILIILAFRKIPYIGDFHMVHRRGVLDLLIGWDGYPANYTLWFLRDLYVYFVVAPLFWILARELPIVGLVALFVVWNVLPQGSLGLVEFRGAVFFHLGCVLAVNRVSLDGHRGHTVLLAVVYAAALFIATWAELVRFDPVVTGYVRNVGLIPGILLAWRLSDCAALRDNRTLLRLSGYAFFLYLLHEPTLSYIISSSVYVFVPGGTITGIVYYVLVGGLTVAVVLGLGSLLARFAPPVYGLLTGFRRPAGR